MKRRKDFPLLNEWNSYFLRENFRKMKPGIAPAYLGLVNFTAQSKAKPQEYLWTFSLTVEALYCAMPMLNPLRMRIEQYLKNFTNRSPGFLGDFYRKSDYRSQAVEEATAPQFVPQIKDFWEESDLAAMQKIRDAGGEAYSYASDYEIIGKLKRFADRHSICIVTVHHTRKQPAGDSFETISGTTGLLGCADGALLMQKKKRTALEATVDAVGRDQQDQILYLKKDAGAQIRSLERTENEPYQEPPDPVLDTVSQLASSESREWTGSPTELAETVNTGMAANALAKYLNVKSGRLLDEYHVRYENRALHSGRQVKLTYMIIDIVEYEVIE